MPYGLPNAAATYQRLTRGIMEAQEARHSVALAEMEMVREEPPAPPEPPEGPWAWGLVRIGFRSPPSLLHQHSFVLNIIR